MEQFITLISILFIFYSAASCAAENVNTHDWEVTGQSKLCSGEHGFALASPISTFGNTRRHPLSVVVQC